MLPDDSVFPNSSPSSAFRLKPGAPLVFKFTPGLGGPLLVDVGDDEGVAFGLFAFLGGGRNELRPEKSPDPPVFARFAGGSMPGGLSLEICGRLTMILPGLDRSTTFWNCFLEDATGLDVVLMGASVSEPEASESE